MRLTEELYGAARPIWDAQLEHPFIRGIADGSLEEERFARWVRQDYRYLIDFARVFAWAAAKAERLEAMSWYASVLDLTLNTEMELHRAYARRFGIEPEALAEEPMWPTTRAYTDFLVRTAADGDMAWGNADVGRPFAEAEPPEDQRYADWSPSTPPTSSPRLPPGFVTSSTARPRGRRRRSARASPSSSSSRAATSGSSGRCAGTVKTGPCERSRPATAARDRRRAERRRRRAAPAGAGNDDREPPIEAEADLTARLREADHAVLAVK